MAAIEKTLVSIKIVPIVVYEDDATISGMCVWKEVFVYSDGTTETQYVDSESCKTPKEDKG